MFKVCSRLERRLLAVPTSRYSYPGMGFGDTFACCTPLSHGRKRCFLRGIRESRYCPINRAGRPPRLIINTVSGYLTHPFGASNVVRVVFVGFIPALKHGAFSLTFRNRTVGAWHHHRGPRRPRRPGDVLSRRVPARRQGRGDHRSLPPDAVRRAGGPRQRHSAREKSVQRTVAGSRPDGAVPNRLYSGIDNRRICHESKTRSATSTRGVTS